MILRLFLLFTLFLFMNCSNPEEPNRNSNAPEDHTVNKDGYMHKSGLSKPATNCVSCHGSDLKGGTSGVSCFQCHGKEW